MLNDVPPLRVALIGHGFMGAAHSQGWRVAPRFFDLPARPEMALLVGRDARGVEASARKWGWEETHTDWRAAIARDLREHKNHGQLSPAIFGAKKIVGNRRP